MAVAGDTRQPEGSIACLAMSRSPPLRTSTQPESSPRAADRRRRRRTAQSQQELGLRAHACAQRAAIRTTPAHQDRQIRTLRSATRARIYRSPDVRSAIALAALQWRASYSTKSQREERILSMTRSKRQYGSGCLLKRGKGWAIRWREMEIAPDGTRRKAQRYEALGEVTRKQASDTLAQRLAAGGNSSQANAIASRVPNLGGRMAGSRVADVQALDAEESSAHS